MSWKNVKFGALGTSLLLSSSVVAQQFTDTEADPINGAKSLRAEPFTGIVINQMITVTGQDFYQYFVAAWQDKEMSDRYAISLRERPSARLGSQVWVEYAHRRVFQMFLPPSRSSLKRLSEQAVDITYQNIVDTDIQRLFFRDLDLGPDEL